ncbi:MAG: MotA/TolQ/ExbB proton channel family protein [Verrucomicrobiota bacterium]
MDSMDVLIENVLNVFNGVPFVKGALESGIDLWGKGGWAMIPLALNALILYGKAAEIRWELGRKDFTSERWELGSKKCSYRMPTEVARGYLVSRGAMLGKDPGPEAMRDAFDEVRAEEMPPIDRNLKFMKVAMSAAPLWGLLGTVTGMLVTFDSLARGGGSDDTMNNIAGGISEALITTQTGLMVALPGYFFHYYLVRRRDAFARFLSRLETSSAQQFINHKGGSNDRGGNDPEGISGSRESGGANGLLVNPDSVPA